MRQGLTIPATGYTSDNIRPQIALDRDPPHLDLLSLSGGTALQTTAPETKTENLATIKHNLGYRPKVLVYIYIVNNGSYGLGKVFFATGIVDDYIGYEVNSTNLIIKHTLTDYLGLGYTSTAPQYKLQVKYMIFSIPENQRIQDV